MAANYFAGMSKESIGKKGKLSSDALARPVPDVSFKFRHYRTVVKDNSELKKYEINSDEYYQKNGCQFLEVRTNSKYTGLLHKLLKYFECHFLR